VKVTFTTVAASGTSTKAPPLSRDLGGPGPCTVAGSTGFGTSTPAAGWSKRGGGAGVGLGVGEVTSFGGGVIDGPAAGGADAGVTSSPVPPPPLAGGKDDCSTYQAGAVLGPACHCNI